MSLTNNRTLAVIVKAREELEQTLKQGTLLLKNLDLQVQRTLAASTFERTSSLCLNDTDAADYARRISGFGWVLQDAGKAIRESLPRDTVATP